MGALDTAVRSGKALYVGISSYNSQRTREAAAILRELGTPFIIHQPSYSMINRWVEEDGLLDTLEGLGVGSIVFSPLAQGMLTAKYLGGIPEDSRAAQGKSLRQSLPQRADDREHPSAERHRREARPDAGADGAGLGAARRPGDVGADRRQPARAGRGLRRRAEELRIQRRGTRRDRPVMRARRTSISGRSRRNSRDRRGRRSSGNDFRMAGREPPSWSLRPCPVGSQWHHSYLGGYTSINSQRVIDQMPDAHDVLFRTLADPTRRALFERLCREGEQTVGALTARAGDLAAGRLKASRNAEACRAGARPPRRPPDAL